MHQTLAGRTRLSMWLAATTLTSALWHTGTLIFITAMGIVGLTVFNINKRRKQIGKRRALDATRFDVLRYFLIENLIITASGVIIGAALAIAFNIFLVRSFDIPRIEWYFAP